MRDENRRVMDELEMYHHSTAWASYDFSVQALAQGRRAKAQEQFLEAMYHHSKLPGWFTDTKLDDNMKKLGEMLTRGF